MDPQRFADQVRDALVHFHDRGYLQTHPLGRRLPRGPLDGHEGARLQRALLDSLEEMKPEIGGSPSMPEWRRQRYLFLRYVEGLTHERIVQQLGISHRQGHRDHHDGLEALVSLLRARLASPETDARDQSPERASALAERPTADRLLEAELVKLDRAAEHAPTNLADVLGAVLDIVSVMAASSGARVRIAVESGLPTVTVNRDAVRQALLGLLSYALERNPGGQLVLRATAAGDEVTLWLVSEGEIPAIEQASLPTEPRLRASQRLLELQGGSLDLSPPAEPNPSVIARVRLPALRPTGMLLIDDDPDFAQLVRRFLRGHPYRVLVATHARRALELAGEGAAQVIVLDVLMPSQDGWEILRQLRQIDQTRDVPIVVCSVLADWALARSLGATAVLPKPVTQRSLLEALSSVRVNREARRGFRADIE